MDENLEIGGELENSDKAKKRKRRGEQARMELYDWLQCVVSAVLCGIFVFIFIGRPIGVDGDSMRDTLYNTDRVIMTNLFYSPHNGDIIIFRANTFESPLVKRVIAVAGQTIDISFESGAVTVYDTDDFAAGNLSAGVVLDEPYIRAPTHERENFEGPVSVPDGFVFVMGDNRNDSTDSRSLRVGLVDTRQILGKVLFVAIPGADEYGMRGWSRVGSVYG